MVTGSAGFVGIPLCQQLVENGHEVNALVRSSSLDHPLRRPGINIIEGDLLEPESLEKAVDGCGQIYHLAAFTGVWSPDPTIYHKVNVDGTKAVLDAAVPAVRRVCG